jgi:hypothetical protein
VFWAAWLLLAAFGGALDAASAISNLHPGVGQDAPITSLNYSVLLAAPLLGIGQWLVLRQKIRRAGWWVLATGIAAIPALVAATIVLIGAGAFGGYTAPGLIPTAFALALGWAMIGFGQWIVLRRQVRQSGWWIAASGAAGAASAVGAAAAGGNSSTTVLALLLVGLAGGAAYGVISGVGLGLLLARTRPPIASSRAISGK